MPYFAYILYSESKDRYYVGSCEDVLIRLKRHNDGATPSTKPYRPWKIVWTERHELKSEYLTTLFVVSVSHLLFSRNKGILPITFQVD